MRRMLLPVLLLAACTTATPPPAQAPSPTPPAAAGLTVEQEAQILALEDRREFDAAVVNAWTASPNRVQRERMALALARIGPHTFVDGNGNGQRDEGERQAGVDQLIAMSRDPEHVVRRVVAFALGEIGDPAAIDTLFALASDIESPVASEAAEALAKLAPKAPLARYVELTRPSEGRPDAVRARAIQYLFRFASDEAGAAAAAALDDPSATVREAAVYALSRRAHAPARDRLQLMMNDPATLTRAYAAAALGRIASGDSFRVLVTGLGDLHPWVRTNSASALLRILPNDRTRLSVEDLPRILALVEDADAGTRAVGVELLGWYASVNDTARRRLTDILANGTRWERELAAGTLALHFGEGALPAELTSWQKVRVLENAKVWGAGLRKRWVTDPDPMVRASAISTIVDSAVAAETPTIAAGLKDPDVVVRANAIDRLTKSQSSDVLGMLMAYERSEQSAEMNDARLAAISGIAEIEYGGREAFLRALLTDGDPVVRRLAADLLAEKLDVPRPQYTPLPVRPVDYAEVVRWAREPHTATIKLARGNVRLALLAYDAPMTAWNFAQLAKKGYFDNSSFMRVVPNFVVQGGDPRNDMNGGPGYSIRDEINLQKYTRGAVGMALSGPDTGGSQFFITHSPQPHLDGGYTIFGRVIGGMGGVVDQTERGDKVETIVIDDGRPATAEQMEGPQHTPLPLATGRMTPEAVISLPDYGKLKGEYAPDTSLVDYMATMVKPDDRVEIYLGTWCDDSQREVPRFLRILDAIAAQGKTVPVTFVAVDRSKTRPADLLAGKSIEKVPTFIYYRGAQELGRIVEKPNTVLEDDLLAITGTPR